MKTRQCNKHWYEMRSCYKSTIVKIQKLQKVKIH